MESQRCIWHDLSGKAGEQVSTKGSTRLKHTSESIAKQTNSPAKIIESQDNSCWKGPLNVI